MAFMNIPGIRIPGRKGTADMEPLIMNNVKSVTIPTSMHIGAPAIPTVKDGDKVSICQLIADSASPLSAPIHASISGTVKSIGKMLQANGTYCQAITIESDGEMRMSDDIKIPSVNSYEEFIDAVRGCGAVGLGGAGFPTALKLDIKDTSKLNCIIVNGAECEPYITSDTRVMTDRVDDIRHGIFNLNKFLKPKKIIFGIEENKRLCINNMKKLAKEFDNVSVKALPSRYPQGHEKVLIYEIIGKTVPEGKLPIDVGAIVINCTTVAKIGNYISTGLPIVSKIITVAGDAVKNPCNVKVPLGTSIADVFEFCGGFSKTPKKILYGGPMMGISVSDINSPILKNTNALLAFSDDGVFKKEPSSCINCGKCVRNCPMGLEPADLEAAYSKRDYEKLLKLSVSLCTECGCCSYVCPANRHLTQSNKLAKAAVRSYMNAKKQQEKERIDHKNE